ncbi:DnaJ domain-containing protein [Pseudomonas nitroreducens]|uniref:DnaJ domain-containing protein n=1 Tax=Pseudomonas nitroreducens TaxID=46680 RepID=UPI0023F8AD25|nr:DnaJ domain-containing protein [Pseudomonas nitroreducens]WEW95628.1 DnaJ domain-containing protein [Pseudomonas nitroreducens]
MRTHYDNLHVSEKASPEVIKAAYKALAQKWHPDRNPDKLELANRNFKIILRAYEVLSNPDAKSAYDEKIKAERTRAEPESARHRPQPQEEPPRQQQPKHESPRQDAPRSEKDKWQQSSSTPPPGTSDTKARRKDQLLSGVHPWRRFWARFVDCLIFSIVGGFVAEWLLMVSANVRIGALIGTSLLGWIALSFLSVVILESFCLTAFGTTPGKVIFGVKVRSSYGKTISFYQAANRTISVTLTGQAALIPPFSAIAMLVGYYKLKKSGITRWDRRASTEVRCVRMGPGRFILCTVTALIAMAVNNILIKNLTNQHSVPLYSHSTTYAPSSIRPTQQPIVPIQNTAKAPTPVADYTGTVSYQEPGNRDAWPETDLATINSKTRWYYIKRHYVIAIANDTQNAIKVLKISVSSKNCDTNGVEWKSFNVNLDRVFPAGRTATIQFYAVDGAELPAPTSCLAIKNLWSSR